MAAPSFAIFLNGSYGVGKSSALDHIGDLLAERAVPFSLMDVDWFHRSWPPAANDPENVLTEAANMAAVWRNYRDIGPRQLVVAGVIASKQDGQRYESALNLQLRSVRLRASDTVTETRLRSRYSIHQAQALDWHLERHAALSASLDSADLDELIIDTDARTPRSVAVEIINFFGAA